MKRSEEGGVGEEKKEHGKCKRRQWSRQKWGPKE